MDRKWWTLTVGSVADLAGRRVVFAVGIVIFTISSALCGAASSSTFPMIRSRDFHPDPQAAEVEGDGRPTGDEAAALTAEPE